MITPGEGSASDEPEFGRREIVTLRRAVRPNQ
jgi:hypothetical protein